MQLKRTIGVLMVVGAAFAADPTLHISEADAKKAAIDKPIPAYPMMARQLKVRGQVRLEATVNVEGSVEDVRILAGNPILTKPAVDAVKKWRFHPFQDQGKPSAAIVALSFEFDTN